MYALILQSQERVEVLGFVHYGGALRAVYRDDGGLVSDIDVSGIRMVPNTYDEVLVNELDTIIGSEPLVQ